MKDSSHILFVVFLFLIGFAAIISLNLKGYLYYLTPLDARPYRSDYIVMKPSGSYSHGLGIFGSLMIIVGVSTYSSRKRLRSLWKLGKLHSWLEFHIFLCLVGPLLVLYHTTFKAGGIAAISLWTMVSVASSGIVGRFFYTLIPRNMNGTELTLDEIDKQLQELNSSLQSNAIGEKILQVIDESFAGIKKPSSIGEMVSSLLHLQKIKSHIRHTTHSLIASSSLNRETAKQITEVANDRAVLYQKTIFLQQAEKVFYYWHAIHLPFSIIMFITLAAHVTVAYLLGYRWVW